METQICSKSLFFLVCFLPLQEAVFYLRCMLYVGKNCVEQCNVLKYESDLRRRSAFIGSHSPRSFPKSLWEFMK